MEEFSILSILKKIPIFADLNESEHQQIINSIMMYYYPTGHVFFNEGDKNPDDGLYIIKHGMVKISRKDPISKEDKEISTLIDNDFFGEMALILDEPRNASATAIADCEVFRLAKKDLMTLMQTNQNLSNKISAEFIDREKKNDKIAGAL